MVTSNSKPITPLRDELTPIDVPALYNLKGRKQTEQVLFAKSPVSIEENPVLIIYRHGNV